MQTAALSEAPFSSKFAEPTSLLTGRYRQINFSGRREVFFGTAALALAVAIFVLSKWQPFPAISLLFLPALAWMLTGIGLSFFFKKSYQVSLY